MDKIEFKEIWDICPTGTGDFWRKHRNRYLPRTLEKWFDEHLDNLINSQWVSVEDELPKDNKKVLGFINFSKDFGHHEIVCYDSRDESWCPYFDELLEVNVTHWQPLPNPPKGK